MDLILISIYISIFNEYISINEDKIKELREVFFPSPSIVNLIDIREIIEYPEAIIYNLQVIME
jgi:hypothetical protein